MIPIRDANPTHRRPFVTLLLIALNAAAFLLWEPITGTAREQSGPGRRHVAAEWRGRPQSGYDDGGTHVVTLSLGDLMCAVSG